MVVAFSARSASLIKSDFGNREKQLVLKKALLIFLVACALAGSPKISEAEVALVNPTTVKLSGKIDGRTINEFNAIWRSNPGLRTVELDSPGGLILSALIVADAVAEAEMNTWVRPGSTCASACSIIFLAGELRLADGRLGVHQVSGVSDPSVTQSVIAEIYRSLTRFRAPEDLIYVMLRTPPDDMYFFSPEELEEFGINIRPGDSATYEPPHLQVLTSELYKDWLVGTFLNTRTQRPFFAMESRATDPVFRLVHYPHDNSTFFEVIWDKPFQAEGQTDLRFRFFRRDDEPYDSWARVTQDQRGFYADIPSGPNIEEDVLRFLAAFMYGTSLRISDFSGSTLAEFSLMGTLRTSGIFQDLVAKAHRN